MCCRISEWHDSSYTPTRNCPQSLDVFILKRRRRSHVTTPPWLNDTYDERCDIHDVLQGFYPYCLKKNIKKEMVGGFFTTPRASISRFSPRLPACSFVLPVSKQPPHARQPPVSTEQQQQHAQSPTGAHRKALGLAPCPPCDRALQHAGSFFFVIEHVWT